MIYKSGSSVPNADCLSRLPQPEVPKEVPIVGEAVLLLEALGSGQVTLPDIRQCTRRDPVLSQVLEQVLVGWQNSEKDEFKPFQQRKEELMVLDGCLQWGNRVVILPSLRPRVLFVT